jgi:hypothetical protein
VIDHAIRLTVDVTRKSYIWPARHQAGSTTSMNAPPMGQRYRLKASFDTAGYSRAAKIVLVALKKYGMILADNGSNWYISGAPDDRMPDDEINGLKKVKGSDFEAVQSIDDKGDPLTPGSGILPRLAAPRRRGSEDPAIHALNGRRISPERGVSAQWAIEVGVPTLLLRH